MIIELATVDISSLFRWRAAYSHLHLLSHGVDGFACHSLLGAHDAVRGLEQVIRRLAEVFLNLHLLLQEPVRHAVHLALGNGLDGKVEQFADAGVVAHDAHRLQLRRRVYGTYDEVSDGQPDFFAYPGEEHNMRGHASVHLHERITRYFEDYLK